MIEGRALIDSAVPSYALGVEMIQELVHHRLRRTGDRAVAVADGQDIADLCTLLAFDTTILDASLHLIERVPTIRARDAVHAATALVHGIETVISTDPAFDEIPGLRRIGPAEALA